MPLPLSAVLAAAVVVAVTSLAVSGAAGAGPAAASIAGPPGDRRNAHYAGNRAPLAPSPLVPLPVRAIEPRGWLRKQLELQAQGFHGHLGEISRFLKKEKNSWLDPKGQGEHGWEEVPYWLKGYAHGAYVLNDPAMIAEAKVWMDGAIASQQPDGWFGPRKAKSTVESTKGEHDLWPNMVMLFCLQSYHDHSGDPRVLELMRRYFRWELDLPEDQFLPPYWQQQRAADNLYSVYWLYNRTGEPWLLDLAAKIFRRTADWDEGIASWHNVNIAQGFGGPATFWQQSRDKKHLDAAERNWQEVRRLYGQVPGGMFGSDENCRPGFSGPRQAIESCGIVEEMLSDERLLQITGDARWADRCEDAAFNSLPAAMTADLRALRYLTAPNHVRSDAAPKNPGIQNGGPMYLMDPHDHRCCQHNVGHGWPYLASSLWMATGDNGLAATFYGDSKVTAKVGDAGGEVRVDQRTHYPFDERVELTVNAARAVRFPLYLRVPGWCESPAVQVNGADVAVAAKPQSYIVIDREWKDGDTVRLTLPMKVRVTRWAANGNTVSVHRGPLTYSLKIDEEYRRAGGTEKWPAHEIWPASAWNYGLVLNKADPAASFEVVKRDWPENDTPFTHEGSPLLLKGKGRRIPQWQTDERGLVHEVQASPVRSGEPVDEITLIPMGAARLRVSAFPVIGDGPDAREWKLPEKPIPQDVALSASHCFRADSVAAASDGAEPRSSSDDTIPRLTFWPHKGTAEWVEAQFPRAREVSGVSVYWYDDTARGGGCRVPESWQVLYRAGDQWKPVSPGGAYGTAADRFNVVQFEPVTTDALMLKVKLREGFSAGVLEWRVEPYVSRTK